MERVYLVQNADNPMMFVEEGVAHRYGHGVQWTHVRDDAHGFRSEDFALRFINNWLNGKGYVIPRLRTRSSRRAA